MISERRFSYRLVTTTKMLVVEGSDYKKWISSATMFMRVQTFHFNFRWIVIGI